MSGVFSGLLKVPTLKLIVRTAFRALFVALVFSWQAKPSEFMDAEKLVLLWTAPQKAPSSQPERPMKRRKSLRIHESERIYGDRLVSMADLKKPEPQAEYCNHHSIMYMLLYSYMYVCMYVCMNACICVCTYVCIHIYIYVEREREA